MHADIQVSGFAAKRRGFAAAGNANLLAVIDAGRNRHRELVFAARDARAVAPAAHFLRFLPASMTGIARFLHAHVAE